MASVKVPDLAIDLGTCRTRIASRSEGVLADVPTAVALRGSELVASGDAALELRTSAARGITVVAPVRNGVVTEFTAVERFLTELLGPHRGRLRGPRALVTFGAESTEVERRAAIDCIRAAGVREVVPLDRMLAAGLGAGLAIHDPTGHLVVDVGGGGARVAILCLGRALLQGAAPAGGDDVTERLRSWLAEAHDVLLSPADVDELKHRLFLPSNVASEVRVRGLARGGAAVRETSFQVATARGVVDSASQPLLDLTRRILRETTSEISGDIYHRGCVLTGGGSRLDGLESRLRDMTSLATVTVDEPARAVIRGCLELLGDATNPTWKGLSRAR